MQKKAPSHSTSRVVQDSSLDAALAWRPIETAPQGTVTVLLAAVGCEIVVTGYADFKDNLCTDGHEPTHWMPLPAPPNPITQTGTSKTRTEIIREQQRSGGSEVTAVMVSRLPDGLRDDLWTSFPNIHLRVLDAERGGIEIQICDCGMSGHCRPQAWARIEKHNRDRLADAVRLPSTQATASP